MRLHAWRQHAEEEEGRNVNNLTSSAHECDEPTIDTSGPVAVVSPRCGINRAQSCLALGADGFKKENADERARTTCEDNMRLAKAKSS